MRICLDFDGVLHNPHDRDPGFRMGKPVPGALEAVQALLRAGHKLYVHTSRIQHAEDFEHVHAWLAYFFFPVHRMLLVSTKPLADVYLDDKAVRFTSWDQLHHQPEWYNVVTQKARPGGVGATEPGS